MLPMTPPPAARRRSIVALIAGVVAGSVLLIATGAAQRSNGLLSPLKTRAERTNYTETSDTTTSYRSSAR